MFKKLIQWKLEHLVRRYLKKHKDIKVVAIVGSVGKTSTKVAVGTVLSEQFRIRLHEGNHNAELSTPLAILGIEYPDNLKSPRTWLHIFKAAKERIRQPSDVDIIVQEVGTDRIGQVPHFGKYVKPYLTIVTAVSPEHMEYFGSMDAVAAEELAAANYSEHALINRDDIDGKYAQLVTNKNIQTYGTTEAAEFFITQNDISLEDGVNGSLHAPVDQVKHVTLQVLGEQSVRIAAGAAAAGLVLGMPIEKVAAGLEKVRPVSGRMNMLRGMDNTIIIDDSYNSSPLAAAAALRTLYSLNVPQRIAVLGSMNELGGLSEQAHRELGLMCDPAELAHVITVGEEARKYLAPAAQERGCHTVSFISALDAGAYVHKMMESGAAILFKGSEGRIYLEEAIKIILHATEEESQLVRQDPAWLKRKNAYFESLVPEIEKED